MSSINLRDLRAENLALAKVYCGEKAEKHSEDEPLKNKVQEQKEKEYLGLLLQRNASGSRLKVLFVRTNGRNCHK